MKMRQCNPHGLGPECRVCCGPQQFEGIIQDVAVYELSHRLSLSSAFQVVQESPSRSPGLLATWLFRLEDARMLRGIDRRYDGYACCLRASSLFSLRSPLNT